MEKSNEVYIRSGRQEKSGMAFAVKGRFAPTSETFLKRRTPSSNESEVGSMTMKKEGMTIRPVKAMPAKEMPKKAEKKTATKPVGLHPETKRIIEAVKTKKAGQIFEVKLTDMKKAKRRRDAVMRYVKRHKAPIKRVVQQGKLLFVEVGGTV